MEDAALEETAGYASLAAVLYSIAWYGKIVSDQRKKEPIFCLPLFMPCLKCVAKKMNTSCAKFGSLPRQK
jgi:hypothetical protein